MAYVNYIKVCQRQWLPTMFREGQVMFENEKSTIKSSEKFSLPKTYIAIDLKSFTRLSSVWSAASIR